MRRKLFFFSVLLLVTFGLSLSVVPSTAVYSPQVGHWIQGTFEESSGYNDTSWGPSYWKAVDVVNRSITSVSGGNTTLSITHNGNVTWPTEPGTHSYAILYDNDSIVHSPESPPSTFTATETVKINSTGYVVEASNNYDDGPNHATHIMAYYNHSGPGEDFITVIPFAEVDMFWSLGSIQFFDTTGYSLGHNVSILDKTGYANFTIIDETTLNVAGQSIQAWKVEFTATNNEPTGIHTETIEGNIITTEKTVYAYIEKNTGLLIKQDIGEQVTADIIHPYPDYTKTVTSSIQITDTNIDLTTGETVSEFNTSLILILSISLALTIRTLTNKHLKSYQQKAKMGNK